ncbi:MAG: diguanylate cyclase [Wenzhouxiangellaceae bacterium]|nr:diguanylate cyclase [Wenzhouxiangellaceae bacterium]
MPVGRIAARFLGAALATLAGVAVAQPADLDARLDVIERVNETRPWPVSQAMLDELEPELDGATLAQRTRADLIRSRNLALDERWQEALELLDEILKRPIGIDIRLKALERAANIHQVLENHSRAFALLSNAIELLPEATRAEDKAGTLGFAARLHASAGQVAMAMDYAARARELARESGSPRLDCWTLHVLAGVQLEAGRKALALETARELLETCQAAEAPVLRAVGSAVMGNALLENGEVGSAIGWLERAVDQTRAAGYAVGVDDARVDLGRALVRAGRGEEGAEVLTSVLEHAGVGDADLYVVHTTLADVREEQGRHADALEHLEAAEVVQQRLFDQRLARQIAYHQVEFESEVRDQELELLRQQNRVFALEREAEQRRQRTRWIGAAMIALVAILLGVLLLRMQHERRRYRRLAKRDGLTGLYNHSRFHIVAAEALARARERGKVSALIAADVDLFKQVNDRYGHQAGDAVLAALGTMLAELFPPPDVVGRVGGEEFAIFLPGSNRLQARQRVEQIRRRLQPVSFGGESIAITLSFGIAEARGRTRLEALRSRADDALYRAKRAGRNQTVDADEMWNDGA